MSDELPKGWALPSLGELCPIQSGFAFKSTDFRQRGIPLVRISNLVYGQVQITDRTAYLPPTYAQQYENFLLHPGDVLIAMSGATTGKMSTFALNQPALLNQRVGRFPVQEALGLEKQYLTLLVRRITEQVAKSAYGGAQPNISPKQIAEMAAPLPPLPEQKRIVKKIEDLQSRSKRARIALESIPPLIEKFRQSVLTSAFRGDLTKKWREKNQDKIEPASELLKRIRIERRKKWEEEQLKKFEASGKLPKNEKWKEKYKEPEPVNTEGLPELPEGWCWAGLEALSYDLTVGHVGPMKQHYVASGIAFLRSQNVRQNRFDPSDILFITETFHAQLSKSVLRPGDVVVVRSGAPGTACVIPEELKEANCADLVIIRPTSIYEPRLLAFFLNSPFTAGHVRSTQVGVAQQRFNVGSARIMCIPVPPPAEQAQLLNTLDTAFDSVSRVVETLDICESRLPSLDQSILAKAFRGELVPQDPNDEPASVLLERIKKEREENELEAKKGKLKQNGKHKAEVTQQVVKSSQRMKEEAEIERRRGKKKSKGIELGL